MVAPLATIAGTGLPKGFIAKLAYYVHKLEGHAEVFSIPGFGMTGLENGAKRLAPEIEAWLSGLVHQSTVMMGHSQGVPQVFEYTLSHPNQVLGVVGLCGPLGGTTVGQPVTGLLNPVFARVAPSIADMCHGSDYLDDLQARVARNWPTHAKVRLIAGDRDRLVRPRRSAFSAQFPEGTQVRRYWFGRVRPRGLPDDVRFVFHPWASHLTLMGDPRITEIIRRLRRGQPALLAA